VSPPGWGDRPGVPPDCVIDSDRTRLDTTLLITAVNCIVQCSTSTVEDRFSGEPFCKWDIQFDHPQIGIVTAPTLPICGHLGEIVHILWRPNYQSDLPVRPDPTLQTAGIAVVMQGNDQDRACLRFTSREHHPHPAGIVDPPEQSAD
jgi:hypothetical protein